MVLNFFEQGYSWPNHTAFTNPIHHLRLVFPWLSSTRLVSTHHLQNASPQPYGPGWWVIFHQEFFSCPFHTESPLAHSIGTFSTEHVPCALRSLRPNTKLGSPDTPHFARWIYSRALKKNHNWKSDQMDVQGERYKLNWLGDWRTLLKTGLWWKRTAVTHPEKKSYGKSKALKI